MLGPSSPRLVTGTPTEQERARREWHRHQRIRQIVNSDKVEIPRSELVFDRFWIEHEPSGDFFRAFDGDPQFADDVPAYYVNALGRPGHVAASPQPGEPRRVRTAPAHARGAPQRAEAHGGLGQAT